MAGCLRVQLFAPFNYNDNGTEIRFITQGVPDKGGSSLPFSAPSRTGHLKSGTP